MKIKSMLCIFMAAALVAAAWAEPPNSVGGVRRVAFVSLFGSDMQAGAPNLATVKIMMDGADTLLKDFREGSIAWTAWDLNGYNTGNQLTVASARSGVPLSKADSVLVTARKAYTTIRIRSEYYDSVSMSRARDSVDLWVGPGPAAKLYVEITDDSLQSLRSANRVDTVRICGACTENTDFYAIVRDQYDNWVDAASDTRGTIMWTSADQTIAGAAKGPNPARGQGKATRVGNEGIARFTVTYTPNGGSALLTANGFIKVENIIYTDIEIGVKLSGAFIPISSSAAPNNAGTINAVVNTDTTLWARLRRPDGNWTEAVPVNWTSTGIPGVTNPTGPLGSWKIKPSELTATGKVTAGIPSGFGTGSVSVNIVVKQNNPVVEPPGDPVRIRIEGREGPVGDTLILSFTDDHQLLFAVALDAQGNKIGDYPSDWRADHPVIVNQTDRPVIVYSPGNAVENWCGWLVVTGTENKSFKDSLYICMTGRMEMPLYAITRDYDGCGYLDRIEMRYGKPVYFKGGSTATVKNPNANLIGVKYNTTDLAVDSVTVSPKDSSAAIWLRDVVPHGSTPLQTGWTPTVAIGKGFLYTGNGEDNDVCGTDATQTINTRDGAAPVIEYAKLILDENFMIVKFSERIRPYDRPTFGSDRETINFNFPPGLLFNIWTKWGLLNKAADTRSLSKTAGDPNADAVVMQAGALNGIMGVYPNDEYSLKFFLIDGIKVGPPGGYINIRTFDQVIDPVNQTSMEDRLGNAPGQNNRKVKITYGTAADAVAVASRDRVIPAAARPGEELAVAAPAVPLTAEFAVGPNPAGKSSGGAVSFFRHGSRATCSTLSIYNAAGNIVRKIRVIDDSVDGRSIRKVSSWDLRDANGRPVPDGTYLVRGKIKTKNGKTERVSLAVGVARQPY